MAMAKKGSRKIVVAGRALRWRVSPWRRLSAWTPADAGLVDEGWLARATALGLGAMADVVFNVPIEDYAAPKSQLQVRYFAKIVDGFLGPEQFTRLTPAFVQELIERAVAAGWDPDGPGPFHLTVVENQAGVHRPVLLVLGEPSAADRAYDLLVVATRIR